MKKVIPFFFVGILFGVVLIKSEVASFYRIYEMFRFKSFHMYGVIGSAIITGIVLLQLSEKKNVKTKKGDLLKVPKKNRSNYRYLIGGLLFGLGWALVGACPGPMFALIGAGFPVVIVPLLSAVVGTFVYGLVKDKLPH